MRGSMPVTGAPITRTSPVVGLSRPVIMLSVVDLPQPVGPTIAMNSPLATDMLKSRNAIVALPSGEMKRHDTELNSMTGDSLETAWFIANPGKWPAPPLAAPVKARAPAKAGTHGAGLFRLHERVGVGLRQIDVLALDRRVEA